MHFSASSSDSNVYERSKPSLGSNDAQPKHISTVALYIFYIPEWGLYLSVWQDLGPLPPCLWGFLHCISWTGKTYFKCEFRGWRLRLNKREETREAPESGCNMTSCFMFLLPLFPRRNGWPANCESDCTLPSLSFPFSDNWYHLCGRWCSFMQLAVVWKQAYHLCFVQHVMSKVTIWSSPSEAGQS